MTATVRSVRVVLEADVASYVRDMRLAGRETDAAFSRLGGRLDTVDKQSSAAAKSTDELADSLGDVAAQTDKVTKSTDRSTRTRDESTKSTERSTKKTKEYTLELAVAEEQSNRLRKALREQARAQLDAADGVKPVDLGGGGSSKEIDRLSGRLRLLTDLAVTVGPALIPLGASTIPVLTGSIAGLVAAGAGLGITVAAVTGLGDAIEAIDAYRLEPTAQNLAKVRQESEKLGPAGADFARYLANLEPELRNLQNTARAGMFPGFEDGIDSLLDRGPQINALISDIARGIGDIARDAGESLAGDEFDAFFNYLETYARPTLESLARSAGNLGLGIANFLVAFAPASRDFTDGLESMTRSFARWTAGLNDNQGFQDFLSYVREAGPEAIQFVGAVSGAVAGLLKAAAPVGSTLLPVLSAVADAFAAIAGSDLGPSLYIAVAAFLAFSRATAIAQRAMDRISTSSERTTTSLGKYATLGAGVVGVASAVGILADNINRIDSENLDRSLTALGQGNETDTITKVIDSLSELTAFRNKIDLGEIFTLGGLAGDSSLDKFADNVDQVDKALAQMVESGNADQAADLFNRIQSLASAKGIDPSEVSSRFDAYALALDNAAGSASDAEGDFFGLGASLAAAAGSAADLTTELATLNGFFDKRDAVRGYRDAIDAVAEGLKDGFSRDDAANIDAVGRSILQVAEQIKNPKAQANFLAGARAQLVEMAQTSGPRAAAVIEEIIAKFDDTRLTNPPPIKLTADQKAAEAAFERTRRAAAGISNTRAEAKITANSVQGDKTLADFGIKLRRTGQSSATAQVSVNPGNSIGLLDTIRAGIAAIRSKSVTITTHYQNIGNKPKAPTPGDPNSSADGGTVPRTGLPYADRHPYLLADGEEVISNRNGQADRHRPLLKAINAGRLADGGTATYVRRTGVDPNEEKATDRDDGRTKRAPKPKPFYEAASFADFETATLYMTRGMKGLRRELNSLKRQAGKLEKANEAQQKAVDAATQAFERAQGRYDGIASTTTNTLTSDIFAEREASANPWMEGATAGGADPIAALEEDIARSDLFGQLRGQLSGRGLNQGALEEASSKGIEALQLLANYSDSDLQRFSALYTQRGAAVSAQATDTANLFAGEELRAANAELAVQTRIQQGMQAEQRETTSAVKALESTINQLKESNKRDSESNAQQTAQGVNGAAGKGKNNQVYGTGRGGRRR